MAEVVYWVSKQLAPILKDEVLFLWGVREQVEEMERELNRMQASHEYADSHPSDDPRIKNWVNEIRDIAYEAEDVIEDFIINEQRRRREGMFGFLERICACIIPCMYACIPCALITHHEVGMKIKKINKKMKEISDSSSMYGIPYIGEGSTSPVSQPQRSSKPLLPLEEENIIGLDGEVEEIMRRLTDGDDRLCVISIFGMAGLGKTTLARKAYIKVKGSMNFGCFAWIDVSKGYDQKDLLLVMVKKIMGKMGVELAKEFDEKKLFEEDIAEKLCDFLKKTKYFIILDDIWSVEFWKTMNVFRDVKNGSAVMITTRFEVVARSVGPNSFPIKLKFPNSEECLNLLVKEAGLQDASSCPSALLDPANQIVDKCGRLPLAIVALGGILLGKNQIATEWQEVADKIMWELSKKPQDCIHVLATKENTMEEVAQEYLIDLINKNMVQMDEEDYIGGVATCRVHDLMRELAILKATETRFLSTKPLTDARRLTISKTVGEDEAVIGDQPIFEKLRTLLAFNTDSEKLKYLCCGSPRVKVLQTSRCGIDVHDLGRKHHLRYLEIQIKNFDVDIPQNISRLYHLQTLSIYVDHFPKYEKAINMYQLRNLRHLILSGLFAGFISMDSLWRAKDLQTLDGIVAGDWIESSLPKLTNLRTLKINDCEESHRKALEESLVQLKCLITLHLKGKGGFPSLCTLSSLVNLRDMDIRRYSGLSFFGNVPKSHEELPHNLNRLSLYRCDPNHYPIAMLGKLTCLRLIWIDENSDDHRDDYEVWHMKHGDFPHLQVLDLSYVKRLREWIIEDGALLQLHSLNIFYCNKLEMLPAGLRHISTLRELYLTIKSGTPLEGRVEKETGEDWDKIKHVPTKRVDID
ncbi:putative disease resistance protein [Acorus calamus]|uniref:Disease resistance protein n=1 Tax=Acorus calamus TaxID=4465 RepID=A0AAV9FC47_ACOCL|nr:putative disease resistance protein [Acorus calamus]